MNLFYLDHDIKRCVQYHVDRHVVKMPIESAQALCTVMREDYGIDYGYKSAYVNHPIVRWVAFSLANFKYMHKLGLNLCKEYTYRYGRTHATEAVLMGIVPHMAQIIDMANPFPFTEPPKVVSAELKELSTVEAYRGYYIRVKKRLHSWKHREIPYWIQEAQ